VVLLAPAEDEMVLIQSTNGDEWIRSFRMVVVVDDDQTLSARF
jgi:hypothetical protein